MKILKHKLFLPVSVLTLIIIGGVSFFLLGQAEEKGKLKTFSRDFTEYQRLVSEVSVSALLPIVDYSKDKCAEDYCGKDNFFSYVQKSIDFQETNSYRAKNAQLATDNYTLNQDLLDRFDSKNSDLDMQVARMLELSSSIKDSGNREVAMSIVKDMRSLQAIYEKLRINEFSIFAVQRELLEKLVKENGVIPDLAFLKKGGETISKLREDQEEMFNQANKLKQEIEDQFSVYKGKNGL